MKTLAKIEKQVTLSISPISGGGVVLEVTTHYENSSSSESFRLTSGQAGALVYGIEEAEAFGFASAHGV